MIIAFKKIKQYNAASELKLGAPIYFDNKFKKYIMSSLTTSTSIEGIIVRFINQNEFLLKTDPGIIPITETYLKDIKDPLNNFNNFVKIIGDFSDTNSKDLWLSKNPGELVTHNINNSSIKIGYFSDRGIEFEIHELKEEYHIQEFNDTKEPLNIKTDIKFVKKQNLKQIYMYSFINYKKINEWVNPFDLENPIIKYFDENNLPDLNEWIIEYYQPKHNMWYKTLHFFSENKIENIKPEISPYIYNSDGCDGDKK